MPVDLAISYLAPAIQAFGERYPSIDFELDLTPRRVDLLTDGFDLAIRMGEPPQTPATLIARHIGLLPRHLYASPGYLAAAPALAHPRDLDAHGCLVLGAARQRCSWTLVSTAETLVVPVQGRYTMNNVGLCKAMATLGMGIAVLTPRHVRDDLDAGLLQRVLPAWEVAPVPVHAIVESRLLPSRVRLFIDFIRESLRAYSLPL